MALAFPDWFHFVFAFGGMGCLILLLFRHITDDPTVRQRFWNAFLALFLVIFILMGIAVGFWNRLGIGAIVGLAAFIGLRYWQLKKRGGD